MRKLPVLILAAQGLPPLDMAQPQRAFEVASIKPNKEGGGPYMRVGPGRLMKTGLTGPFDVTLKWINDPSSPSFDGLGGAPTSEPALQEQLGLRVQAARGPVEVLVIDKVERRRSDRLLSVGM